MDLRFGLDTKQSSKVLEFMSLQSGDKAYEGSIGGRFTYSFTPTSLGTVTKVRDNISGEELDVTDYGAW